MTALQIDNLRVRIFETRSGCGRAAGEQAAEAIGRAIAARKSARIILASAPSQNELLEALTAAAVDWARVTIFHMDEYVGLDANHLASFRRYQREHVLNRIHPVAFHGITGEAEDVQAECRRYAALLSEAAIDLVCLGIGENGHIAFNDPPVANFSDPQLVKVVELDEACRRQQVNDGCFPAIDAVPRMAITLTVPALMRARELVGVVPGPQKARAVHDALEGPVSIACPASVLRRHTRATLYLDTDSASLLNDLRQSGN